jgi:hypothetical protein
MRLNARAFGMAAGATAAVLFTVCSLAVAVVPGATTAFFGYLVHMDLSGLPRTLTFGSFIGGLVAWTLGTAITFGLAAAIYNRLTGVATAAPAATRHQAAARPA